MSIASLTQDFYVSCLHLKIVFFCLPAFVVIVLAVFLGYAEEPELSATCLLR